MSQSEPGGDRPRRGATVSLGEYAALQQQNQTLMDWVGELERTLAETQAVATVVAGADASERIIQLETALNQAQRFVQQQQAEVEALQEALTRQQQRVAEMERNCVAALQQCREQEEKGAILTESCRRLQDRLDREQRQSLQLKQALDQCLASQNRYFLTPEPAASRAADSFAAASPDTPMVRRRVELPYFLYSTMGSSSGHR